MKQETRFRVAVLPGDGIGIEVTDAALSVLDSVQQNASSI
jgi:isocitrate/isopropylmalate dehydrogenase